MSSLEPEVGAQETGEPKVINESPESRTVEAITLDFRFTQQDRMRTDTSSWTGSDGIKHVDTGFSYERNCERFRAAPDSDGERRFAGRPEAQISQTISSYDGSTISTKIETEVSGNGLGGSTTYRAERYPHGTFDMNESSISFYARAGAAGTGFPEGIRSVSVTEETRVHHPVNPKFRETITNSHYRISRQSGGWKDSGKGEVGGNKVADIEVIDIEIGRDGSISGSSQLITKAARPSGWMVLSPDSFRDPVNYSPEEAQKTWEDVRGLVESARSAVKSHPDAGLVFEPQDQYLIPGGLNAKPEQPLKDFQAKEVLRAI